MEGASGGHRQTAQVRSRDGGGCEKLVRAGAAARAVRCHQLTVVRRAREQACKDAIDRHEARARRQGIGLAVTAVVGGRAVLEVVARGSAIGIDRAIERGTVGCVFEAGCVTAVGGAERVATYSEGSRIEYPLVSRYCTMFWYSTRREASKAELAGWNWSATGPGWPARVGGRESRRVGFTGAVGFADDLHRGHASIQMSFWRW